MAWTPGPATAQASDPPVQFDIAEQALAPALEALAREAGIEILFDRSLMGARRAPPLHGRMTVTQALARLLAGSGLTALHTAGGAYVVVRTTSGGEPTADPNGLQLVADPNPPRPPDPPRVAELLIVGRRSLDADIQRRMDDIQPYQVSTQADVASAQALSLEDFFRSRFPADAQSIAMVQAPAMNQASTQSRIDLHGLGAGQTLVLVDGRRMPSAPAFDDFLQPDLNGIPLGAVDRIESLTSTAGGIFGPGATGGVVNIVLRRNVDGVEMTATGGMTQKGDGGHWRLDTLSGGSFFGGRTRVTLALSAADDNGLIQGARDFTQIALDQRTGLHIDDASPPISDSINVANASGGNLRFNRANGNGRLAGPLTSVPYSTEGRTAVLAALSANAGDTFDSSLSPDGQGRLANLVTSVRTLSGVFSLRQEIDPNIEVLVDGLYLDSLGTAAGPRYATGGLYVGPGEHGNPFRQNVFVSFPTPDASSDMTNHGVTARATLGVIRRLGHEWTSEADLTLGRATVDIRAPDLVGAQSNVAVLLAQHPEVDLFSGGSAITALFSGQSKPITDQSSAVDDLTDLNLRLAGPVIGAPGGPLTVTLSGELRHEANPGMVTYSLYSDPVRAGSQKQTVGSLYGEARAPLLPMDRGGPLKGLELQLALRGDDYDITVPIPNYALLLPGNGSVPVSSRRQTVALTTGFRTFPLPGVELRASYATGYLPPAPYQIVPALFMTPQQAGNGYPGDPRRGGNPLSSEGDFLTKYNGSPALEPEKAVTFSAGVVLTPDWAPGLRLSVDYTRIDKSHEIRVPSTGNQYEWLLAHEADFPNRVTRAPLTPDDIAAGYTGGVITAVDFSPMNIGRSSLDTVDFDLDYRRQTRLGALRLYGKATWTARYEQQGDPYSAPYDTVGRIDGPLEWRGNVSASLARGSWTLEVNAQVLSGYRVSYGATDLFYQLESEANVLLQGGQEKVAWQGYLDSMLTYAPRGRRLQVRLGVRNLLDARPPLVFIPLSPIILNTGEHPDAGIGYSPYGDPRGRRFEVSLTQRF